MILKLIIYDIESDKYRKKLADYLEACGLIRIQKSAFCGRHAPHQWERIQHKMSKLHKYYGLENDRIYCLMISVASFRKMQCTGEPPDIKRILDEYITMWV